MLTKSRGLEEVCLSVDDLPQAVFPTGMLQATRSGHACLDARLRLNQFVQLIIITLDVAAQVQKGPERRR